MMTAAQRCFDPSPFRRRVVMQIPRYLSAARGDEEERDGADEEDPEEEEDEDSLSADDDDDDTGSSSKPLLTDERKANLFQFLLRDLQVEGVPLLGIDADQVQTLQAAIWTTMAGLLASAVTGGDEQEERESSSSALLAPSPSNDEPKQSAETTESPTTTEPQQQPQSSSSVSKVCLVFEDIPVEALTAFVQDFQTLQNDVLLRQNTLPEMMY
jgi:hypothetical protein